MQHIEQAVNKFFPEHDVNLSGFVPVKSIPLFLNSVFHELGYNTINVNEEQAHQIFEIVDQDDNKVVTKEEITKGLVKILNDHGNLQKPQTTWSTITELPTSKIHKPQPQVEEQQLNYLFQKYDKDNSGCLDKNQIVDFTNQYLKLLGKTHQFDKEQSGVLIGWLDKSEGKKINKQEIWKMYTVHLAGYT